MGVWLSKNFIEVSRTTLKLGSVLERYGYKDIDEEFISAIVNDDKITCVQISDSLPEKVSLNKKEVCGEQQLGTYYLYDGRRQNL